MVLISQEGAEWTEGRRAARRSPNGQESFGRRGGGEWPGGSFAAMRMLSGSEGTKGSEGRRVASSAAQTPPGQDIFHSTEVGGGCDPPRVSKLNVIELSVKKKNGGLISSTRDC